MTHAPIVIARAIDVKRYCPPVASLSLSAESARVSLGERMKEARGAKGLSQHALARAAKVSQAHISNVENGKRDTLGSDLVAPVAEALGVSLEWLLTGEGPRERRDDAPARTVELDDPYPTRADAIARMKGAVSDEAIATVRGVQNLGGLTVQEWVDELLRADRLARKGREPEGREHEGDGPVGRTGSKVSPRRGR